MKKHKRTDEFTATSTKGKQFTIYQYTRYVDTKGVKNAPEVIDSIYYETSEGEKVNHLTADEYEMTKSKVRLTKQSTVEIHPKEIEIQPSESED